MGRGVGVYNPDGTPMTSLDMVRLIARHAGWQEAEQDASDRAYCELEFRKIRQYVRVHYDTMGRILSATSDNRHLPSRGTYQAVMDRLTRDAKEIGKP